MDFKTTVLPKELKVTEELLPEVFGLFFGITPNGVPIFDYTEYIERNNLTPINYKVFMRTQADMIKTLASSTGRKTCDLFYQNTNGHILVANELVMLYLAFVNPQMLLYFNTLLTDILSEGVAYSNMFIYEIASNRLPSEAMQEIIKDRKNEAG